MDVPLSVTAEERYTTSLRYSLALLGDLSHASTLLPISNTLASMQHPQRIVHTVRID
jgi:hypothetical protein